MVDFVKRTVNLEKLAKDPKIFKIKIGENKLVMDKDLFQLFCVEANLFHPDGIDILAGKILNGNDIAILTRIGIFIFRLSKDFGLTSLLYTKSEGKCRKYKKNEWVPKG